MRQNANDVLIVSLLQLNLYQKSHSFCILEGDYHSFITYLTVSCTSLSPITLLGDDYLMIGLPLE